MNHRGFFKALGLGTAAVVVLGCSAFVQSANAAPAAPAGPLTFSPEAVEKAIKNGVEFLKKSQGADGSWPGHTENYPVGPTAIATYALLESDLIKVADPKIKSALDWLAKRQAPARLAAPLPGGKTAPVAAGGTNIFCHKTYELGLRANAFLAAMKRSGMSNSPYKPFLRSDVAMLWLSTKDGSYGYDSLGNGLSSGDNSNSQYGVLGVWAGVQADEEVPREYWYKVLKHWLECQASEGGWGYRGKGDPSATMTTAGLASMFLCYDNLLSDGFVKCDQGEKVQAVLKPLNKGLDWMDKYFQGGGQRGIGNNFYLLYGIERVGLASGYKYFGKSDWYKVGAEQLLQSQGADGAWQGGYGPVVDTAYALLFLIRGRHAILFNKLEYDGDWNDRPRDMAKLTQWIGKEFEETTVNWQIVNLKVKPEEWLDAPILYISGSTAPKFTDEQIAAIRRYVNMGGTILSCTECKGKGFREGIRAVYAKMFPKYKLEPVPQNHKFFSINFKPDTKTGSTLQGLEMIHNGARPLVVHTDHDLPRSWQLMLASTDKPSFEGPANIALYLTDGAVAEKALAARGATTWPQDPNYEPARQVDVARLAYNTTGGKEGNCDPEPLAWERFSRIMAQKYKAKVVVSGLMPISKLSESGADVAVLCGTDRIVANDQEIKALQAFVAGGGLLYVEAVGGAWAARNAAAFAESGEALASQVAAGLPESVAGTKRLRRLTLDSPLFTQKDFVIDSVRFRKFSNQTAGTDQRPLLRGVLNGKNMPVILFSNEDISGGLVGYARSEVHGYTPQSAFALMRNIVLTKAHAPVTTQPATQPASAPASAPADTK